MAEWPVQWRWEGTSGHPRRITDTLVQTLEEEGFAVGLADVPVKWGPVGSVGEFDGAIVARRRQSSAEAVRRKWFAAAVGVVLVPVVVGIFMVRYALDGRRLHVAVDWRGEAYSATARADKGGFGAERAGIISDVRVTLRAAVFDANHMAKDLSDLQPTLDRVQWRLSEMLPTLTMPAGAPPGPGEADTVEGAFTPAAPRLEDAAQPPALDEGRKDA